MGALATLFRPDIQARDVMDNFWWGSLGMPSVAGVTVSAETSLQTSVVWACVRLIADSIAMMPIKIYRRLPDGGKEEAPEHPLWDVLHDAPNPDQPAYHWKRLMMVHALLWGNAYSRIMPGPRGPVDQLVPVHPDQVQVERVASIGYGGMRVYKTRYVVRGEDGTTEIVNGEDMFHLPGLSTDGRKGLSLIEYARDSVGLALAAKSYSARFYSQYARPGGILTYPGKLQDSAKQRLKEVWQEAHSGLANAHKVAVLPEDVKWQQIGMSNADAQLIEQLNWSVEDITRYFNVPLHMIQAMEKSTSWGSGLEDMAAKFVIFTLVPWVRAWEDMIRKDLIVASRTYFAEFLVDSLLRGTLKDRYEAYAIGRQWGFVSVNEIRRRENMNPIGPEGDRYLEPLNMGEAGKRAPAATQGHYLSLLDEAAKRVVRKETAALSKLARRTADDAEAWERGVEEFYAEHVLFVAETLRLPKTVAERWCAEQRAILEARGATVLQDWETTRVGHLLALALWEWSDERAEVSTRGGDGIWGHLGDPA